MNILIENSAFQNMGLCIGKKCQDDDQIDDFLQVCIQMIFYEKFSLSGLVPEYIEQRSIEIIDTLKRVFKFSNVDIDFQKINNNDSDDLIKKVGKKYCLGIDHRLEEYKIQIENPIGLLPPLNDETFERLKKCTEAVKNNNIDILMKGDLYQQSTFSTDSSLVKIICSEEEIFKKFVKFSKDYDWNESITLQIISDLRVLTNKILAEKNDKIYSPAVRRGRRERIILDKIILLKIEKITNDVAAELYSPTTITMPSVKDYIIEKGEGNPIEILKIVSGLREKFRPVREYIQKMEKNNKSFPQQTLNEISTRAVEEAKIGKPSKHKKVIENTHDLNLGPLGTYSVPVFSEMGRRNKLHHCVLAFTEISNDMPKYNEGYFYDKELKKNCMKEKK